jgi:beta-lactam-binding protein with PASTA domain/tRNA A-37 threonylcarbamoyl transferase component Bud32
MDDPTVYADRYEIVREIARGGMANVYLAKDRKLDRPVALKVLPAELSRDSTFVERFRLEAQAAASLNDPTIVAVYDWGQEQETSFIVMEFVEGHTLRDTITTGPVEPVPAARIAADISKALSAAHRAGVVHRDIKPGNVLITPTGEVKVADFGIARANGTGDGLTRTGAVMGTATYFSPEQAQGLTVDARSDLYSLGVVLYEMGTGVVPFEGDSAVSVAYSHVREPVPAPSTRRADLPPALETIILTCLQKDPAARYQTADELRADLLRFTRGQAPIGGPATAAVVATAATTALPATSVAAAVPILPSRPPAKNKRGPVALVVALLVVLIAVIVFLLVQVFRDNSTSAGTVAVKDVVGLTEIRARNELTGQGFKVTVKREATSQPEGVVVDQNPQDGVLAPKGSAVQIVVSSGGEKVKVPKVAGLPVDEAEQRLVTLNLVVSRQSQPSDTVPVNITIGTLPKAGAQLAPGANVVLVYSAGPAPIAVPDVSGLDDIAATSRLTAAGLKVTRTLEASSTVPSGTVIRTQPSPGTQVAKDSTVTIVVSSGPKQASVPDVTGQTQSAATSALRAAGFEVAVSTITSPGSVGKVISQSPAGGSKAEVGSTVTITVGVAPPTTSTSSATPPST